MRRDTTYRQPIQRWRDGTKLRFCGQRFVRRALRRSSSRAESTVGVPPCRGTPCARRLRRPPGPPRLRAASAAAADCSCRCCCCCWAIDIAADGGADETPRAPGASLIASGERPHTDLPTTGGIDCAALPPLPAPPPPPEGDPIPAARRCAIAALDASAERRCCSSTARDAANSACAADVNVTNAPFAALRGPGPVAFGDVWNVLTLKTRPKLRRGRRRGAGAGARSVARRERVSERDGGATARCGRRE